MCGGMRCARACHRSRRACVRRVRGNGVTNGVEGCASSRWTRMELLYVGRSGWKHESRPKSASPLLETLHSNHYNFSASGIFRKGRSEKTLGSEKTLSQMTSHERRKTVARAPRNRRICAQMRRICDAQCHICARRMPHLRRTMPHLRRTMPHLRAQNATSATPPCAICDASMCDLRRFHV
jgi:hypothetical protein